MPLSPSDIHALSFRGVRGKQIKCIFIVRKIYYCTSEDKRPRINLYAIFYIISLWHIKWACNYFGFRGSRLSYIEVVIVIL